MYFVDSRSVNLTDWSKLWEIIGDLMKTHAETEHEINSTIEMIKEDDIKLVTDSKNFQMRLIRRMYK